MSSNTFDNASFDLFSSCHSFTQFTDLFCFLHILFNVFKTVYLYLQKAMLLQQQSFDTEQGSVDIGKSVFDDSV